MSELFKREWHLNAPGLICPGCFKLCNCMSAEHETEPFDGMITICLCGTKLKIVGSGRAMRYVKATRDDIRGLDKKNRRRLAQYEIAIYMVKKNRK